VLVTQQGKNNAMHLTNVQRALCGVERALPRPAMPQKEVASAAPGPLSDSGTVKMGPRIGEYW